GGFTMSGGAPLTVTPGEAGAFYPNYTGTDITGDLTINGKLALHLNGVDHGNGSGSTYSRLDIDGYIDLTGVGLELVHAGDYEPAPGDEFTLIKNLLGPENQNFGNITGEFNELPDFTVISDFLGAEGVEGVIRYNEGINGKDVVIWLRDACELPAQAPANPAVYQISSTSVEIYWEP